MSDILPRVEIRQTAVYARWFAALRDLRAKALGGGISELRIDYGPGYRIYFTRRGAALIVLLTGGDKSRQSADIAKARALAAELE